MDHFYTDDEREAAHAMFRCWYAQHYGNPEDAQRILDKWYEIANHIYLQHRAVEDESRRFFDRHVSDLVNNMNWVQFRRNGVWHQQRFSDPNKTFCGRSISKGKATFIEPRSAEVPLCKACTSVKDLIDHEFTQAIDTYSDELSEQYT